MTSMADQCLFSPEAESSTLTLLGISQLADSLRWTLQIGKWVPGIEGLPCLAGLSFMTGDPEAPGWESSPLLDPVSRAMEDMGPFPLLWTDVRHQK